MRDGGKRRNILYTANSKERDPGLSNSEEEGKGFKETKSN